MTAYLHQRFPELREKLGHARLGDGPTPLRALPHLSTNYPIWVKDDGAYGTGGWGGNKIRKLEWLLSDVKRQRRSTILTFGGLGTNWGLATALYARDFGIHTALALIDQPRDDHVEAQLERLRASGADIYLTRTKARTVAAAPYLYVRHRRPYLLPAGGSSPLGVLGYVEAAFELAAQVQAGTMPTPSSIVTAVGSGGTVAGLYLGLGLAGLPDTQVIGIVVNDKLRLDHRAITSPAERAAHLLERRGAKLPSTTLTPGRLTLLRDWLGTGYGHPTKQGEQALRLAHDAEGLDLDPVYTAKAMAALLDLSASGRLPDGPAIYLQTHGPR
ncbi:1-aminocyclopropane-1-carboxylate deaminase [Mycobacterium intermedium]|uniref:1-aminocyclopropane-1-carboxylate deaminase n=1 Tax=Mycobacterium intermedium TaxID=28445 RepID=A0A1E3SB50_MYCIE|nr:pyridoxal-phosphate dependent enzyme [Mycobacterium intermedium]MCV6962703.1 pyridoxal-phosphate dependent enzyme [Mycobacterium intermedium]ODQ98882.1 1-aminocyclopropane-1-carboxylate deaminase [Mycobacterium intermedium]OPE49538.1 1-aminocyclopropane-1-carboxylate deaminase [Mycobacterium intermedium]ORB00485.1 1-aminocyclopropane-1-carboxylate deaminase [Mycobacterium intermedium]